MCEGQRNELGGVVGEGEVELSNWSNVVGLTTFVVVFGAAIVGLYCYLDMMLCMFRIMFQ